MQRRTGPGAGAHQHLTDADVEIVRAIHMFDGLETQLLNWLVEHATAESYAKDTLLFSAGDPAARFFIVASGRVRLFALTVHGRDTTISFIESGFSCAEAAIFGMQSYPVNAEALAGTRLIQVPAEPFVAQVSRDPALPFRMLAALARWQTRLIQSVTELKTCSPSQRFAAVLLSLTDRASGPVSVPLPLSKSALANSIGIAPESLSRVFTRMRELGVTIDGPLVHVTDVTTLRRHCEQADAAA